MGLEFRKMSWIIEMGEKDIEMITEATTILSSGLNFVDIISK